MERLPRLVQSDRPYVTVSQGLAIVPALGAYGSYAYMQRYLGASKTGLILYLSPVYTALLAWLLLGEALRPYHLAGAACVLPGIWLATRKARAKQP